jgi:hypothetical protein
MTKALKAKGRTLAEFLPLLPAEEKLLAAARNGEVARLGDGKRPEGEAICYRQAADAPPPQVHFVKSQLLAEALWRRAPRTSKDGARLWAARFEGRDLIALGKDAQAPKEAIRLVAARNRRGWTIPRIDKREIVELAKAVADLEARRLRPGFVRFLALGGDDSAPVHERGVQISGGWIDGDMDCQGAVLPHDLILWQCRLDGDLILRGATTRTLNLGGTRLKGIEGDQLETTGGVFLREGFNASGEVRLPGARIGGNLECDGGRFDNPGGDALSCNGAEIKGSASLRKGFRASGTVRLLGARMEGSLSCVGGRFENPKGMALLCDGLETKGGVFLREGFHAFGEVRLLGARIGNILDCVGGRFENPGGFALAFDGAEIKGTVFLRRGFHACGEVRLLGARIGGDLECDGGRFENPGETALSCDRLETTGSVFLRRGFHACGETRLPGSRIGGDFRCDDGRFENPKGVALWCDGAQIAGPLFLRDGARLDGALGLSAAQVGSLVDEEACWPKAIVLDGFRYDRLAGDAPVDAAARIGWLDRQSEMHLTTDFKPQPWEQLIKVLREMGHHHAARDIAIEKQNQLRRVGKIRGYVAVPLHWLFGVLAGYGYRPLRPAKIAFWLWLGFALIYHLMAGQGVFGPSNPLVFDNPKYAHCRPDAPEVSATGKPRVGNWVWCADSPGEYAAFSPLAYSLDLILPVISLGQANEWGPITPASAPDKRELQRFGNLMFDILKIGDPRTWEWLQNPDDPAKWREFLGLVTRFLVWFEILMGWLFSGLMVAVLSGLAKKDDA